MSHFWQMGVYGGFMQEFKIVLIKGDHYEEYGRWQAVFYVYPEIAEGERIYFTTALSWIVQCGSGKEHGGEW